MELRYYQKDGLNAIWNYFANGGKGNPILAWPGGTGKSVVPAAFISKAMQLYPESRFMMITHVKELIKQNHDKFKFFWPNAPVGINSAGLKQRDYAQPIIYGGIQSIYGSPQLFGRRDIVFIDECHLLSGKDDSMYGVFLAGLKLINPKLKIVGLSATPYRMGQGLLTEGNIFTDIIHDLTDFDNFNKLLAEGYLSLLIPKQLKTEFDISNVGIQNGEYVNTQLEAAVNKQEQTYKAVKEMVEYGYDRKSWLIFASGIKHAEEIAAMLNMFGIDAAAVHSKKDSDYCDAAISAFKEYRLRCIVNYGKLTTGFDHPGVDLLSILRWTLSIPLWVQMLYRGTRPAEGKNNCLVLDFARNTPRLGPINDPRIPVKKGQAKPGDAPVKLCDKCGAYNHARSAFCCDCGHEFKFQSNLASTAGTHDLIKTDKADIPVIENFNVEWCLYNSGQKIDKETKLPLGDPYIVATYFCGKPKPYKEFVFPESHGYGRNIFKNWWHQRHASEPPHKVEECIKILSDLKKPRRISVHTNLRYPQVTGVEF